jgi:hypothetical protein
MSAPRRFDKQPYNPAFDRDIKFLSQFTGSSLFGAIGVGLLEFFARFKYLHDNRISTLNKIIDEKDNIVMFTHSDSANEIAKEKIMHVQCFYDLIEIIADQSKSIPYSFALLNAYTMVEFEKYMPIIESATENIMIGILDDEKRAELRRCDYMSNSYVFILMNRLTAKFEFNCYVHTLGEEKEYQKEGYVSRTTNLHPIMELLVCDGNYSLLYRPLHINQEINENFPKRGEELLREPFATS